MKSFDFKSRSLVRSFHLGGTEEPRKLNSLFSKDTLGGNPSLRDDLHKKINKAVHLGAAGYRATQTLVGPAAPLLLLPLGGPALPVISNGFLCFSAKSFRSLSITRGVYQIFHYFPHVRQGPFKISPKFGVLFLDFRSLPPNKKEVITLSDFHPDAELAVSCGCDPRYLSAINIMREVE